MRERQTDLVRDFDFPKVITCECDHKCSVLTEGVITCCLDCVKYSDYCNRVCDKVADP